MTQRTIVGIDLGTTYSLVAHFANGAPRVIPNGLGESLTPSAVSVADDGKVFVGAPARARATTSPQRTFLSFKRDMGTSRIFAVDSLTFRPQELSALVLRSLKGDAEAHLGCQVDEAVVTVPAYFDEMQRRATQDAAKIAGLHVERIINEPTAAALAYGLHERHRNAHVVVLDLGGGTFDVTVLELADGVVEIQASSGDTRLGGDDFDLALADLAFGRWGRDPALRDPLSWARILDASELARRRLSSADKTDVILADIVRDGGSVSRQTTITRAEAESCWTELLSRMRAPVLRALRDAGRKAADVDEVLLVGGATRMPCVVRLATELFGRLPLRSLPPDEAVAMGAAVQAALKRNDAAIDDMVATDIAPFSMGVSTVSTLGMNHVDDVYSPIIERGTVIPASRVRRYCTVENNQTLVQFNVYQGEHAMCKDNRKLGEFQLRGIPPRPAGQEALEVRFTYDLNGILEIDARAVSSGQTVSIVIEQTPGRLSPRQVEEARRAMERLKLHPRDALPNTTALERANALYVELTGAPREQLGLAIAEFRAALADQDPKLIEQVRGALSSLVAALAAAR